MERRDVTTEHTIEYLPISAVKPDPRNPRSHSKKQIQQIADSIGGSGYFNPVLIDEGGMMICGHGRYQAAKLLGRETIPVIRLAGLSATARKALNIADNKIAMNAGWDTDLLRVHLEEIQAEGLNLELTGFAMGEIDMSLTRKADPEDEVIPAVPDQPITRRGDIWICGPHRIGCGDLLDGTSVAALMAGELADAVISDPPYNVEINGFANSKGRHAEFQMASGEMSPEEFLEFIRKFLGVFIAHSRDGGVNYIFMDWRHIADVIAVGRRQYGKFLNLCVWNKSNAGMGSLYRSKHELVAVFRVGDTPHFNAVELGRHGRNRTNVFDYASVNSFVGSRREDLALHPTVKPAALVADAIQDVTRRGEIVLDPFLGSGTLLVACELTGRHARGLEIAPAYVDVALERWIAMTGRQPILESTGETFEHRRAALTTASAEETVDAA
jgi:DNA modification methylase